jgi:uncharacterized protein YecT (DUF1311 family)
MEELARRTSAADYIAHLKNIDVPMNEVDGVLATIGRKPGGTVDEPIKTLPTLEDLIDAKEYASIEAAQSQREMNTLQARRAERLNSRMEAALDELQSLLDDEQFQKLSESQEAWLRFRENECGFTGAFWEGGSMRPFIVAGTASRLTKQRAEMLENEIATLAGR